MIAIKLWELLFAGFFLPAFYFGWRWFFRIAAVFAVSKLAGNIKNKFKGEKPNE